MSRVKNTGGNTQNIDSGEKPKKAKVIAKVELCVLDDGNISGDFFFWEEDELGRRQKWRMCGEAFMTRLAQIQPQNVRSITSALNVQVALAKLPEHMQSEKLGTDENGKLILIGQRPAIETKSEPKPENPVA